MIRFLGKLDKLARQAPVLGEAFVGAFIRTGVNIEAATQSLIFPFQDVSRHLLMPKVSGKIPSDYDGKIVEIFIEEGGDVAVGEPLFTIEIQNQLEEVEKEEV